MKTVLLVPGGGEAVHSRDYKAVLKAIETRGYKARFVPITWSRTTIDKWVPEFMNTYKRYDSAHTILAGFSWGAMTVFAAAAERPPAELWLFSLSPYFAEDMPFIRKSWRKEIGKRRAAAFEALDFHKLASSVSSKTTLYLGEKEVKRFPIMNHRSNDAARAIKDARLVSVPGAGHEVDHPNYIAAIQGNI